MTPFDLFLLLALSHLPLLTIVYLLTTLLVLKSPDKYGGNRFALIFAVNFLLDLLILTSNFISHRLPVFSISTPLFPSHELPHLFRITIAVTYSLPFLHDAISLYLLHNEIPQQNVLFLKMSMDPLHIHLHLSSFLTLLIFILFFFTPISIYSCSYPFQHAHFLLPHTHFSLLPPSPLPLFVLLSTVISITSIGLISHRTLSSPYRDSPLHRGPLVLREQRWIKNLQRIKRNVSCMNYINLLFIALQFLNLRTGQSLHLPAGLYLNGFIVELKIFSTLLMFIYDHTKLSTVLLRILDLCPANRHYDEDSEEAVSHV